VIDSITGTTLCRSCQSKLRCSPDRGIIPVDLVRQSSAHCLLCKMLIESFEMVDVFRLVTRRGSRNVRLSIDMILRRLGTSDDRSDGSKTRYGKDVSQINYFELQGVLIPIKRGTGDENQVLRPSNHPLYNQRYPIHPSGQCARYSGTESDIMFFQGTAPVNRCGLEIRPYPPTSALI
jgi:hypothetical protein